MEKAAAVAVEGTPRPCDMGRFNDRTFVYVAAFGVFTDVSYDTPQEFKSAFGHLPTRWRAPPSWGGWSGAAT